MPSEPVLETQAQSAQRMYNERADKYENSWHPDFSRRFMELAHVKPGHRVLVLACGTGLEAVIAADRVGDKGIVVGVDVAVNMLAEARKKLNADPVLARRLKLVQHDVTDLTTCAEVEKDSFDVIVCCSAFVLLQESEAAVVAHWREYLVLGGRIVIDITHENNLPAGLLLEKVAKRLKIPFPSNRAWITSKDSFLTILKRQGFVVEAVETLEKTIGLGTTYLDLDQADEHFNSTLNGPLLPLMITDELRAKGRKYFQEEWDKAAVDGRIEVSDVVYVYIAKKP
ncbi:hypothetical protein G7046_g7347 [Stylonectria norvegica]|nr:hypothetical protein G7046_g7347 [Stylonectria norvegica]